MSNNNSYCIIMAGGTGRRFWPYSRKALPKQFLDFFGTGRTLLQQTVDRYKQIVPPGNIYIATYRDYEDLVKTQLPDLMPYQLLIEEERRNTAPAIAYASTVIQKANPDATIVVAPCDQLILKPEAFRESILKGLDFASRADRLVTVGIKPTRAETGYGYIQISEEKEEEEGFHHIKTFIEKPALEFAEMFVQNNEFFWNTGIFIWHVNTILNAFRHLLGDRFPSPDDEKPDFSACPNISIDYSILEHAENRFVEVCDFGWADIGTWQALYDASPKDINHNVIVNSNTLLYDCHNNIISMPPGQLAVVQGLEGYLVAMHGNALLVCKKEDQTAIRKFVNDVEMKFGEQYS